MRERHIETTHTGGLVAVDTFFAGTLKGMGGSTFRPCWTATAGTPGARLYTSKLPLRAVQILNNDVLSFFERHRAKVKTILSDNGREYCGRPDKAPCELFLRLKEIEHRTTKVRRPQSNGFIEHFHRTLVEEHLRIQGRTKWYEALDETQADLDAYLVLYNTKRPHQGRGMNGRPPYQVFKEGLAKKTSKAGAAEKKQVKKAA